MNDIVNANDLCDNEKMTLYLVKGTNTTNTSRNNLEPEYYVLLPSGNLISEEDVFINQSFTEKVSSTFLSLIK